MNRELLIKEFLKCFPEYLNLYNEHLEDYDGDFLAHVFFGDILNPKLLELLEDNQDIKEIEKIFSFLDRMAIEGDLDVQEVLTVTILERLGGDQDLLKKGYFYMGKATRKCSDEIEEFWRKLNGKRK